TLTADPNSDSYTLNLLHPIDALSNVDVGNFGEGEGGIGANVFVGYNLDDGAFDLDYDVVSLENGYDVVFSLSARDSNEEAAQVSGSNNGFGVDNPSVNKGETLIISYAQAAAVASFAFTGAEQIYFKAYAADDQLLDDGLISSGELISNIGAISYVELTTLDDGADKDVRFQLTGSSAQIIESTINDVELDFQVSVTDSDGDSDSGSFSILLNAPEPLLIEGTANADELQGTDGADIIIGGTGNDTLIGGAGEDIFTWLDNTLDNGTDVIKDFTLGEDWIDITDVLQDDDYVDIDDLVSIVGVEVVDQNVVLTVSDEGVEQTIVIDNGVEILGDYIGPDNSFNQLEILTQIMKTDAV
ncbi:M10 family metallopeptidase C-terminal domain-containing protein, partial [Vibrio sp.]|uniref:M10 family metallopeptidase C-terminal domain-containing protein n=1 Tax=Vibrio sp. TaxID=678 RepID=UPI003D0E6283